MVNKIKGDYNELKSLIGNYKKVLVTGPHGSGNKIMAKIIAHDFKLLEGRGEYAWSLDDYNSDDCIVTFYKKYKDKEYVFFGPSQSGHLQRITENLKDVLVIFMYKDIESIESYTERNPFVKDESHKYEWKLYRRIVMEEYPESVKYLSQSIEQLTYYLWENHQRELIPNWLEIKHSSLEGHELWIGKEERKDFKEWQTTL